MIEIKGGRMSGKSYLDEEDCIETPLEALQDLSKLIFIHGGVEQYKIIETALKKLEKIDKLPKTEFYTVNKIELNDELAKKLEVLKIIKEKGCSYIEKALIISCKNYEEYCIEMNSNRVYSNIYQNKSAFKTQNEFDTLKEVLL